MQKYTDSEIIAGIKNQDNEVISWVYEYFYKSVSQFVLSNDGNIDEAKDVYQETIIAVYRNVRDNDFTLKSTFKSYIYVIAKYIWYRKSPFGKHKKEELSKVTDILADEDHNIEQIDDTLRMSIFMKAFKRLAEDCKKILQMFMEKISLRQIAKKMGFRSEDYAKRRKYLCKETLIKYMREDPDYSETID